MAATFAFTGLDGDLDFVMQELVKHHEIKYRGRLGSSPQDVKEIDILGCTVRLHEWGISWGADARHREIILKHVGLEEGSKALSKNGYKEQAPAEGEPQEGELSIEDRRT